MLPNTGTAKKKLTIFCHSFQKVKPIYYIDLLHRVKYFKPLFFWHFYDYGLQIMKTHNSVSQKIRILHKINKKGYLKKTCQASIKYVHFYALNTWLGLLFHDLLHQCGVAWFTASMQRGMNYCINAAWHEGNQPVALLRCNESPGSFDSGLQVICIVGSGVSHLLLDNTP